MTHDYEPGAVWPVVDDNEVQIREVYSRFGLAMYMAQVMEHGIVNALLVLSLLPSMKGMADRTSWDEAFDRFYDAELAKTLGNMIRTLEKTGAMPPDLIERLRVAKGYRDHLAHRFFREHDLDFMTKQGRTRMIVECEDRVDLFQSLDREVEAIVSVQRERYGITPEWVAEHVAMMECEARSAEGRVKA